MGKSPNVTALLGGLGNQLFQYAFGVHLQERTGFPTHFDLRPLGSYSLHGGTVHLETFFDINLLRATEGDARGIRRLWECPRILGGLFRLSKYAGPLVPIITDYNFNAESLSGGQYFFGYWQAPKYIGNFHNSITFKEEILESSLLILNKLNIDPKNDVAVHVRRGDFLKSRNSPHLPLPESTYYAPLMQELTRRGARRFLILSDDIASIKGSVLSDFDTVFVDSSMSPSIGTDLCLLSLLDTKVLSASSFSWWGGALGMKKNACVLAPRPWVKLPSADDPVLAAQPLPEWHLIDTVDVQRGVGAARLPKSLNTSLAPEHDVSGIQRQSSNENIGRRSS